MSEQIEQIKKVNVGEETFRAILRMIMQGDWEVGKKLPSENEFKDMLGVSRHTVRAALNNLNMLGLVETRHGDGNYLKAVGIGLYMDILIPYLVVNEKNIDMIMEFRQGIEISAARYAAMRATDEDIAMLQEKLDICNRSINDIDHYLAVDLDFHYTIAQISKNDLLVQSMYVVKNYCFGALTNFVTKEISTDSVSKHIAIFDAIREHDTEQAAQCMNDHITGVIYKIKETGH